MIKVLVDECLTPDLVDVARARWIEADHVSRIGRARSGDWALMRFAIERDYAIVTNNARDFRRLYKGVDLHPGLLIILPQGYYGLQIRLFRRILDYLEEQPDIVNRLIEIDEQGSISSRSWSSLEP